VGVGAPQDCCDELVSLSVEDEQGVVHARFVVAMVEGAFLLAVGGIICGVEIQKHPLGSATPAAFSEVELEHRASDAQALPSARGVLKPGDRRLTGEVRVGLGQASQNQLEQGIFSQGVRVVLVLVAARYLAIAAKTRSALLIIR
jgi:hypothetical protein